MTRLPRSGRMTGLTLLDRLTILSSVVSMEIMNGADRKEGLCSLTVTATHTRLTRTAIPTSRHRDIRGSG